MAETTRSLAWLDRIATALGDMGCYPYYDDERGWVVNSGRKPGSESSGWSGRQGFKEEYRPTLSEAYVAAAERLIGNAEKAATAAARTAQEETERASRVKAALA